MDTNNNGMDMSGADQLARLVSASASRMIHQIEVDEKPNNKKKQKLTEEVKEKQRQTSKKFRMTEKYRKDIERLGKVFKPIEYVVGCMQFQIEKFRPNKDTFRKATQLSNRGDIVPYGCWGRKPAVEDSIGVMYEDGSLGQIEYSRVKRNIKASCKLYTTDWTQLTGICKFGVGGVGYVLVQRTNGECKWQLAQYVEAMDGSRARKICPPKKISPGVDEGAEFDQPEKHPLTLEDTDHKKLIKMYDELKAHLTPSSAAEDGDKSSAAEDGDGEVSETKGCSKDEKMRGDKLQGIGLLTALIDKEFDQNKMDGFIDNHLSKGKKGKGKNVDIDIDLIKKTASLSLAFDALRGNMDARQESEVSNKYMDIIEEEVKSSWLSEGTKPRAVCEAEIPNKKKPKHEFHSSGGTKPREVRKKKRKLCTKCKLRQSQRAGGLCNKCFAGNKYFQELSKSLCRECNSRKPKQLGGLCQPCIARRNNMVRKPRKKCIRCKERTAQKAGSLCRKCFAVQNSGYHRGGYYGQQMAWSWSPHGLVPSVADRPERRANGLVSFVADRPERQRTSAEWNQQGGEKTKEE